MIAPQLTTVSHGGGCVDRAGARVSRCTPTSLSPAICVSVSQSKPLRPVRYDGAETLSLGSLGAEGRSGFLTCGGAVGGVRLSLPCSP